MQSLLTTVKKHAWAFGLAAFLLSLVSWSFASPVGATPDEEFHLMSIWCAAGDRTDLCETTENTAERRVADGLVTASCFAFNPDVTARCQNLGAETFSTTSRGNFSSNYPPVYYGLMSMFATNNVAASVISMRLFNSVFLVGLLALTLRLLPFARRWPTVLAIAVTSVPLGQYLVASINPSGWAIMLVPISWLALHGSLTESRPAKRYALAGIYLLSVALAAGARGDAAVFVGLATVMAIVMTFQRQRDYLTRNLAVFSILGVGVLGGIVLFFSSAQAEVLIKGLPGMDSEGADAARNSLSGALKLLAYNLQNVSSLWTGGFGTWPLGWDDTPMTAGVQFATLFAVAAVIVLTMVFVRGKALAGIALNLAALVIVPVVILQLSAARVGQQVQPRYIFPLIVLLIVALVSVGIEWDFRTRIPIIVGLVGLAVANASALFINMGRHINGLGSMLSLNPDSWWWGSWSPWPILFLGSAAFGALVTVLIIGMPNAADRSQAITPAAARSN